MLFPKLNNKYQVGDTVDGYETLGGVSYKEITINPNEINFLYCIWNVRMMISLIGRNLKEEEFENYLMKLESLRKLL